MFFRHQGTFCFLFSLALLRLQGFFPDSPISMAPIIVVGSYCALLYKINTTIGFRAFFECHFKILSLAASYHFLLIVSLIYSAYRHDRGVEDVVYGMNLIVAQSLVFALTFLFILPQNSRGMSYTRAGFSVNLVHYFLMIVGGLSLVAILFPYFFFNWISYSLTFDFFDYLLKSGNELGVARELWVNHTSGVFAASTDLGAISALIVVFFTASLFENRPPIKQSFVLYLLVSVFISLGLLAHSLSFFLILVTSFFTYFALSVTTTRLDRVKIVVILFSLFHFLIYVAPIGIAYKIKDFLPYFFQYRYGKCGSWEVFYPNITLKALGERGEVWLNAVHIILENFILGVSNGIYRLNYLEFSHYNSHNLILQTFIDAGIIGFVLLSIIAWLVFRKFVQNPKQYPIFMVFGGAVLVSLLVDYYPDHSIPWILVVCYLMAHTLTQKKTFNSSRLTVANTAVFIPFILFLWTLWDHQQRAACFF